MSSIPRIEAHPVLIDDADPPFSLRAQNLLASLGYKHLRDLEVPGTEARLLANKAGGQKVVVWIKRVLEENGYTLGEAPTTSLELPPPAPLPAAPCPGRCSVSIRNFDGSQSIYFGDSITFVGAPTPGALADAVVALGRVMKGTQDNTDLEGGFVLVLRNSGSKS